jgi:competence protein ComEA
MIKKLLFALLALFVAAAFAAVDANKADQAALETIKGIGPAISGKIVDERKKSPFKDWADLVGRVQGIGEANAAKFSAAGLTVNGTTLKGAPAGKPVEKASAAKTSDKKK